MSPASHCLTQSSASVDRHVRVRGGGGGRGGPPALRGGPLIVLHMLRPSMNARYMPGGQGGGGRNSAAGGGGGGNGRSGFMEPTSLSSTLSAPSTAGRMGTITTRTTVLQSSGALPSRSVAFSHASRLPPSLVRSSFDALPPLAPWPKISASDLTSAALEVAIR